MTVSINAAFDSGNIRVVAVEDERIDLEIVADGQAAFHQWFSFRVAGARGRALRLRILNAGGSSFPSGWRGYGVRASVDRVTWRAVPTRYEDGVLAFDWRSESALAWFAYFAPYTIDMHAALVARTAAQAGVSHRELGTSLDGQAIDCLILGDGPKQVWLYGRQHPGESMTGWWMEGALDWLIGPRAASLFGKATLHVVPTLNPDGVRRGHLRTNAIGADLNREWQAPSPERSPEVLCVRDAMAETGVACAMDVHGEEVIAACFLVGFDGVPTWSEARGALFAAFKTRLAERTRDFQPDRGYGKVAPGKANLAISTNQIAERFGALAMTLEMPFKDCEANPHPDTGWSPERSKAMAVACLETLSEMIDKI